MKNYFNRLPDYLLACFLRLDFWLGGILAAIFFGVTHWLGLGGAASTVITVAVILLALIEAGYRTYREERTMRSEREQEIKVTAKLDHIWMNYPDPGPGKSGIAAHVIWEIWAGRDVSFDRLALNVIYVYERRWWQFWKRTRFPQRGIPRKGTDSTEYRLKVMATDPQPQKDQADFEYADDREISADPHWILELVLKSGMPSGEYRVPVFIDQEEARRQRAFPPL